MKPRRQLEPSALQLVEEAVHLLRRAPLLTLAIYYVGAVPFVLGGLFFWAHTTWFQPSGAQVAWGALGLVLLYAGMKTTQAAFCARLLALRLGAVAPSWTLQKWLRVAEAQARLQPWALVTSAFALLLTVPFGWVFAYQQNLSVLADDEKLHDGALEQAKLWPAQNHTGLALIAALTFGVWVNFGVGFVAVPWLANRLLGVDNLFGFSGWWFFNTTFVASVSALTWLVVDPLVKAFYVLRVFHGRARRTGEDVRVELELARRTNRGMVRVAVMVALIWLGLGGVPTTQAAEASTTTKSAASNQAVQPAQLDRAIDAVLAEPEFRWRLRQKERVAANDDSAVSRFVQAGLDTLREMGRSIGRTLRRLVDWLEERFLSDEERRRTQRGEASDISVTRILLYAFIVVAVALILWLVYLLVRGAARQARPVIAAAPVAAATPDLRADDLQAAQLPVDGWLALAREQAQRGEWRLALRALYLATLARLATDGLVALAKFKTNLDYEREVRRRALSRTEVAAQFAARRRHFEDVWYGRAEAGEADVRTWMAELERPAAR